MRIFTIYSTPTCKYCIEAKAHLTRLGESFVEEDARDERNLGYLKSNGFTKVPQIYVETDDEVRRHIGGYDDLRVWLAANP
jgi:glutaredoxin 3